VRDYEFSFTRKDGRRTLVCVTLCNNDLDARAAAQSMMRPEFARVEIWRGSDRVGLKHVH
jgi:hypothetical protein